MYNGYLDRIEFFPETSWSAVGWALDLQQSGQAIAVEITSGDDVVGRAVANLYRADLEQHGIGTGRHGFVAQLKLDMPRDGAGDLDLGVRLAGSGKVICAPKLVRFEPIVGRLEGLRNMFVYGWACNTIDPYTPLSIDILVDDRLAERVVADHQRADLLSYFTSCYGFVWLMPEAFADGVRRQVSARVADQPSFMPGGPLEITVERWQVPPALQRQLQWRKSALEQLRSGERELFLQRWQNPESEVVNISDFLLDRVALATEM
jgi:hypothetical protein